jgi:hypothetical protein
MEFDFDDEIEYINDEIEYINDEIEYKINEERNAEIKKLSRDMEDISEIMTDLSLMISDQRESVEHVVNNVQNTEIIINEAVESLEKTENYVNTNRKIYRNIVIVTSGLGLGALGFLGGPVIGAISILSGCMLGSGIAFVTNNF